MAVVFATTCNQAIGLWAIVCLAAVAAPVATDLGLSVAALGYQVGLAFLATVCACLAAPRVVAALGAKRALMLSMLLAGAGSALIAVGVLALAVVGTVVIGVGYALTNPPSSALLHHAASAGNRSLIFSIKQAGVPLGALLAMALSPVLTLTVDWRLAPAVVALAAFALMIAHHWLIPTALDRAIRPAGPAMAPSPIVQALRPGPLRWMNLVGLTFTSVQMCVVTFLAPTLSEQLGYSLLVAGGVAAFAHIAGIFGRPFWGVVADRVGDNLGVLIALGLMMAACCLCALQLEPTSPRWLVALLFVGLGVTAVGWNGVWLAQIALSVPPNQISRATAGVLFFTFLGGVLGPTCFTLAQTALGSYTAALAVFGVLGVVGAVAAAAVRRMDRRGDA